ncbi:unnamed protein product, partial [Polarella glacialis]
MVKPEDGAATSSSASVRPGVQALAAPCMMMRNIPNKYTQDMLLEEVKQAGFADTYESFYLPVDTKSGVNRGYAFFHFRKLEHAQSFLRAFNGYRMKQSNSSKVVAVVASDTQSFQAHSSVQIHGLNPASLQDWSDQESYAGSWQNAPFQPQRQFRSSSDTNSVAASQFVVQQQTLQRDPNQQVMMHLQLYPHLPQQPVQQM